MKLIDFKEKISKIDSIKILKFDNNGILLFKISENNRVTEHLKKVLSNIVIDNAYYTTSNNEQYYYYAHQVLIEDIIYNIDISKTYKEIYEKIKSNPLINKSQTHVYNNKIEIAFKDTYAKRIVQNELEDNLICEIPRIWQYSFIFKQKTIDEYLKKKEWCKEEHQIMLIDKLLKGD